MSESSDGRKNTKFPLGFVCLTFISIIGLQLGTQYIAHKFSYAAQLGPPIFHVKTYPIYGFWNAILWISQLSRHYRVSDTATRIIGISGMIIAGMFLIGAVVMRLIFRKEGISAEKSLHGSAHWANKDEIVSGALLKAGGVELNDGAVVGGWLDGNNFSKLKILRFDILPSVRGGCQINGNEISKSPKWNRDFSVPIFTGDTVTSSQNKDYKLWFVPYK